MKNSLSISFILILSQILGNHAFLRGLRRGSNKEEIGSSSGQTPEEALLLLLVAGSSEDHNNGARHLGMNKKMGTNKDSSPEEPSNAPSLQPAPKQEQEESTGTDNKGKMKRKKKKCEDSSLQCKKDDECESNMICEEKCCVVPNNNDDVTTSPSAPSLEPSSDPTSMPSQEPSFKPTGAPVCDPHPADAPVLFAEEKDMVYGSYLNGPFAGQQHSWAWPGSNSACTYPRGEGTDQESWEPCAIDSAHHNRTMAFFSYYQDFQLELDNGMLGSMKLGTNAYSCIDEAFSFFPAGNNGVACTAPPDTSSSSDGGYGVRLVKSGRYLHHWYFQSLTCDETSTVRMELKVTPDCIEAYLISENGSPVQWMVHGVSSGLSSGYAALSYCVHCDEGQQWDASFSDCRIVETPVQDDCCMLGVNMCGSTGPTKDCSVPIVSPHSSDMTFTIDESPPVNWMEGETKLVIRRFHHFAWSGWTSFMCVGNTTHSGDGLAGVWPPVGTSLTSSCLTDAGINQTLVAQGAFVRSGGHDGSCPDGSVAVKLSLASNVIRPFENSGDRGTQSSCTLNVNYDNAVIVPSALAIRGDGHNILVKVPQYSADMLVNDEVTVRAMNAAVATTEDSGWRKLKLEFHIDGPTGVTGIGAFLQDPDTKLPLGIHVQMSKNWHSRPEDRQLYDSSWWTGVVHVRVPPSSTTSFQLVIVSQYFGPLHGVSHSQLSLVGWGTNGLWEEVGLGSNGESITYEPDPHHRRNTILDTRPFLTCRESVTGPCGGDPDQTGWTDNHGGSDWLSATTHDGFYQYLVNNTALHQMNGPRLTNATYAASTVDGNWHVQRTASTWSTDATVKHLHSFEYTVQQDIVGNPYKRFSLFMLGTDNYNYMEEPHFVQGIGSASASDSKTYAELNPTGTVGKFQYFPDYIHAEAPAGCGQPEQVSDSSSCWFGMLTPAGSQEKHEAHRGLIVRNFKARLNGIEWPPAAGSTTTDTESPFTYSILRNREDTPARLTLEVSLPTWFLRGLADGTAQFLKDDYIRGDIEQLLPPRESAVYYGDSQRLRSWYTSADVASDYSNAWNIVALEAQRGDDLRVNVLEGSLERKYPPRIHVATSSSSTDNTARFNLDTIANDWPGVVPISITGVQAPDFVFGGVTPSSTAAIASTHRLYRWNETDAAWQVFGILEVGGKADFQLDREVSDGSFTFTYSLRLEFDNVQTCEQFAFGSAPPAGNTPNGGCAASSIIIL